VNAAALFTLSGMTNNYRDGFALAQNILKSGKALSRLERFAALSNVIGNLENKEKLDDCVNA
jgi:anthranilate phosphoribosyltransferase